MLKVSTALITAATTCRFVYWLAEARVDLGSLVSDVTISCVLPRLMAERDSGFCWISCRATSPSCCFAACLPAAFRRIHLHVYCLM